MARPLFVAGLGNPAPYLRTLHSAGNIVLDSLRAELGLGPFTRNTAASGGVTLFHSPATMNVSGPAVARAYKKFLSDLEPDARTRARLVVLHDELELAPGRLKLKRGGSARGHNGLRSVAASMGGPEFLRIGVGIGRPQSRTSDDVARYVLAKVGDDEIRKIRGAAGEVLAMLERIAAEE